MMRSETHTLRRYQRAAAALESERNGPLVHRYIDSNMLDGSGYCRGKFCFSLRRTRAHVHISFSSFSRSVQGAIGCLTVHPVILSIFVLLSHSRYPCFHICTNSVLAFLLQRCLNWEKLYRFYFLSRVFLSLCNSYKHKAINLWICRCICLLSITHLYTPFFSFNHRASSQAL